MTVPASLNAPTTSHSERQTGRARRRRRGAHRASLAAVFAFALIPQPGAAEFPAEIELSALLFANGGDGTVGAVFNGIAVTDASGTSLSSAGAINGDGLPDLLNFCA